MAKPADFGKALGTGVAWLLVACCCQARPLYHFKKASEPPLRTVVSGPFLFTTDLAEEEISQLSLELLELEKTISTELHLPRLAVPVRVYLFQGRSRYEQFLQQTFPNLAGSAQRRRALFLLHDGAPYVVAYRTPELEKDLRHEFTHALLNTTLHDLPVWIDEGLAVFYEAPGEPGGQPFYRALLRSQLSYGRVPRQEELESLTTDLQMEGLDYAAAWSWMQFCLHGPLQARNALLDYLGDLQRTDPGERLPARLKAVIQDPEAAWRVYLERLLASNP